MGGQSCAVPHLAIMHPYVSGNKSVIPSDTSKLPEFDERLRRSCAQTDLNKGLVDAELVGPICEVMGKPKWSDVDRKCVNDSLNSLYV